MTNSIRGKNGGMKEVPMIPRPAQLSARSHEFRTAIVADAASIEASHPWAMLFDVVATGRKPGLPLDWHV
jgi:hypothetical protein